MYPGPGPAGSVCMDLDLAVISLGRTFVANAATTVRCEPRGLVLRHPILLRGYPTSLCLATRFGAQTSPAGSPTATFVLQVPRDHASGALNLFGIDRRSDSLAGSIRMVRQQLADDLFL